MRRANVSSGGSPSSYVQLPLNDRPSPSRTTHALAPLKLPSGWLLPSHAWLPSSGTVSILFSQRSPRHMRTSNTLFDAADPSFHVSMTPEKQAYARHGRLWSQLASPTSMASKLPLSTQESAVVVFFFI